jgi:uncharacterized protein YndB with AHSA1/START domain
VNRRTVSASARSSAQVEAVWTLLATATTWKEWGAFRVAYLEREGVPAPDGVGAIRRFGFPGFASREEVLEFEPPHHLAYTVHSGLPLREYRADVRLTPAPGGGTDISWVSSFRPPWPGTGALWAGLLRLIIGDVARRLAKGAAAARQA